LENHEFILSVDNHAEQRQSRAVDKLFSVCFMVIKLQTHFDCLKGFDKVAILLRAQPNNLKASHIGNCHRIVVHEGDKTDLQQFINKTIQEVAKYQSSANHNILANSASTLCVKRVPRLCQRCYRGPETVLLCSSLKSLKVNKFERQNLSIN
jgi:hypothetical protein